MLDRAGVLLSAEGEVVVGENRASSVTEEELEKLSAFSDFIGELDLDDLGEEETRGE